MTRLTPVAMLGLFLVATGAAAQQTNDVADGRDLALQVCTFCHVVTSNQQFPPILRPPAPTFRSIADRPTTTGASLAAFMRLPHKDLPMPNEMPNLQLSDEQIGKLVAYILSLRGQK
jgi:cytochrome c1